MANVILFQVAGDTATALSSMASTVADVAHVELADERALLDRVDNKTEPIDVVVIGGAAQDAVGVAERLRARNALVSLLWLCPEGSVTPVPPALALHFSSADAVQLLTTLRVSVATARERRARGALERAEGVRDALLSSVVHDIRAPLSVISGAMSELTHPTVGQLNDEQRVLLALVRRSIDRLSRLATNLSYVAKLESGQMELARRRSDLCAVVKEIAQKMPETEDFGELLVQSRSRIRQFLRTPIRRSWRS